MIQIIIYMAAEEADYLTGGLGADYLNGGNGKDSAIYTASVAGVNIDLVSNENYGGAAAGDILINIENIYGSKYDDIIKGDDRHNGLLYGDEGADIIEGNGGKDSLFGGEGSDILSGGRGADILVGGEGADILTGGAGADMFKFSLLEDSSSLAYDSITDFKQTHADKIDLSDLYESINEFSDFNYYTRSC